MPQQSTQPDALVFCLLAQTPASRHRKDLPYYPPCVCVLSPVLKPRKRSAATEAGNSREAQASHCPGTFPPGDGPDIYKLRRSGKRPQNQKKLLGHAQWKHPLSSRQCKLESRANWIRRCSSRDLCSLHMILSTLTGNEPLAYRRKATIEITGRNDCLNDGRMI